MNKSSGRKNDWLLPPCHSVAGVGANTRTTVRSGDDVTPGCVMGIGAAPDRSFQWTATEAGDYTIDTAGSNFDTVLIVRDSCSAGAAQLACNDDRSATNLQSEVNITATAGQTFIITVDGYTAEAGDFVVNIQATAPATDD